MASSGEPNASAPRDAPLDVRRPTGRSPLLLPLAALALLGCGGPAPAPAVTLRIGTFQTQDLLPYYVMQEQGFARQHGLRFVETSFAGGAPAIDAMAAGSLDVCPAVGTVPLMVAAERGLTPGTIVSVAANTLADPEHKGVAVVAGAAIESWQDLRGKRIGSNAKNSVTTAALAARLRREGIADYTVVEIPFSNMGLAVAGGNVAAAGLNEPFLTQSLLRKDGRLLGWVVGGPPFERAAVSMIVFSGDYYRRNPEGVRAYLRAHLLAVAWINANLGGARAVLARRLDLIKEVGDAINLLRWPGDGRTEPALLEEMQPILIEAGVLKGPVAALQLHDPTRLEEVLGEKRPAR